MTEQIAPRGRVREYISPFKDLDPTKISEYETYHGTVGSVIEDLETTLKTSHPSAPVLIYRSYELMKMAVARKIEASRRKQWDNIDPAIKAVSLSMDVAVACYSRSKTALGKVEKFRSFIENSSLRDLLKGTVDESPDIGIMPDHPAEEDEKIASWLMQKKQAGGEDILAIILGDRGFRRGLNVFLDYRAESNTPNSKVWPVRFSKAKMDRVPNMTPKEIVLLQKMSNGRQAVVIGPEDRIGLIQNYFSEIGVRKDGEQKVKIIPVPLRIHT